MRILLTADVHLGLKFARGYPEHVQQRLIDARKKALTTIVELAATERCDLLVVAGDLFDSPRVPRKLVLEAAKILARFEGLCAVLPGNHDYVQDPSEDPIWPIFRDEIGDRHLVLSESREYRLLDFGLPAILFPGPCGTRHSSENAIGWVRNAAEIADSSLLRIGVAHGSLSGLSPDFNDNYYPMTKSELELSGMDLWLLGHTHIRFPDSDTGSGHRIFYPSVPEPDGFDCRHGGYALVIESSRESVPRHHSIPVGRYRFREMVQSVSGESDLNAIEQAFAKLDSERDLVKLTLKGRIPGDTFEDLRRIVSNIEKQVLYLEVDHKHLLRRIQQEDLDRDFAEDSFPHKLLSRLAISADDALALQLAYDFVGKARR